MSEQNRITRREMLSRTGRMAAGVGIGLALGERLAGGVSPAYARGSRRTIGANDNINIAVIGPGGSRGGYRQGLGDTQRLAAHKGVKVVAACDVDQVHLAEAAAALDSDCRKYADFRELLAQKDIDAVVIGTPDHWHAHIAIAAMRAGKDVYCEKPMTLTIEQGRQVVKTWQDTGAVFQTGSQQRSDARFRQACELARNGRIGKIKRVEAHLPTGPTGGPFPSTPPPPDFDWEMWLGPAPETEYVKERTHGNFRYWFDYSGGMLTDWGAHHNDIAQWGLGYDRSGPISVEGSAKGPLIGHNCYNTFPEFALDFAYDNGAVLHVTNQGENGVRFEGEEGWIFVSRERIEASDPKLLTDPLPADAVRLYKSYDHAGNFINCIRSRKQPICDAEIGHRSVSVCHLANICLRLGGDKLIWDPAKERFTDSAAANAMLSRPARKPWGISV
jgi:predicted dehydrogenase